MNVQRYLQQHEVAFELLPHRPAYDAQSLAEAVHVPGKEVAKSVLLHAGSDYALAVVPATANVNLERARDLLGCDRLSLATERECGDRFPDCELGALPPFGSEYGMKTIVDHSLEADEEIVFPCNTHRDALRMRTTDFERLERPLVGDICNASSGRKL